jgi:hypothetical protein
MKNFRAGRILLMALVLASCTFAGCATTLSIKLLYNHADWLITRQLDSYLDLSRPQKAFVSARLDSILDHHRHEALPLYVDVLRQMQIRIQRGLTSDDLDWAFVQYDQLRADLLGRFAQDGADFVYLIEAPQVSRIRSVLEKRLAKQEELLHDQREIRLVQRTKRIVALAREWLGPLSGQQEQEVMQLGMAFPDTLPALYAHERERNEHLLAVLESRAYGDTGARFYEWLVYPDQNADPRFLEVAGQLKCHIASLVLALDRLATPNQRNHVLAKLGDLVRTIEQLRGA